MSCSGLAERWAAKYREETARTLHPAKPHGVDPAFVEWLTVKIRFCYNDLYNLRTMAWAVLAAGMIPCPAVAAQEH